MMRKIIKRIVCYFINSLSFLKPFNPEVIVMVDGGISSQMHQYLLGRYFAEKGMSVTYDLSFFDKCAKDMNGAYDRKFDLLKLFPYLEFRRSQKWKTKLYIKLFFNDGKYFDESYKFKYKNLNPPLYLGGYYYTDIDLWTDFFTRYYKLSISVLDSENNLLAKEIEDQENSVAVHVRKGDLSHYLPAYGFPATDEYFVKGINFFSKKLIDPFFFIFSDEPVWVEEHLLGMLFPDKSKLKIVSLNGSDKGYMDLFLMALCKHQITSKGSFGKFAALLSNSDEKNVVLVDDEIEYIWKQRLANTQFL